MRKEPKNLSPASLTIINSVVPKFSCPILQSPLSGPCTVRGCPLWVSERKVYSCVAAFTTMKNDSDTHTSTGKSKRREEDSKFSLTDVASLYGISRQRFDTSADVGAQVVEALKPLVARRKSSEVAKKAIGSTMTFTYASSVKYEQEGNTYRACICCEAAIEPDDEEAIIALIDRQEVSWCSRECNVSFPIDAWLVSSKYRMHWSVVALNPEAMEDRRLVRDITSDRLSVLNKLATQQGYSA